MSQAARSGNPSRLAETKGSESAIQEEEYEAHYNIARRGLCGRSHRTAGFSRSAEQGYDIHRPEPITESVLVGVTNPVTSSGDFVGFGVVGNPKDGTVEHVGGLTVYSPALDRQLNLKNFTIDLNSGSVTALVPGFGRVPLFTLDGLTLLFTETASQVLVGDNSLTGMEAGLASPEWPFI